ncbi:MAG: tRNA 2-selenouridine(34) synthase MnmH [Burkholderiales bacterium]|nr:tRNA 2-selenouridine(34) synthase MnmH [Burkholderiales bacterium]
MNPSASPSHSRLSEVDAQDALSGFDTIIDVRSESEFAEDHIPGAISCPVLNDRERAEVGTLYKQQSPFDAKKIGAALVAANISRHLQAHFLDRPRDWRPLVYCWRGGERSGAMAHILSRVGWKVGRLRGGYKAYRRAVIAELGTLPAGFDWRVICGMTGTGKSRLLRALQEQGAQVLDLEELAAHRGSVLGNLPGQPQPSQKMFESRLWARLKALSPEQPVFVESESKKIGALRVPDSLIAAMWASSCVVIDAPMAVRVALLKDEYVHFLADTAALNAQLDCLRPLHGTAVIERWQALAGGGAWDELTEDLLSSHYDPAYTRAIAAHYPRLPQALRLKLEGHGEAAIHALAAELAGNAGRPPAA